MTYFLLHNFAIKYLKIFVRNIYLFQYSSLIIYYYVLKKTVSSHLATLFSSSAYVIESRVEGQAAQQMLIDLLRMWSIQNYAEGKFSFSYS